jgi:uncharacterized damage-inducible protein DinB
MTPEQARTIRDLFADLIEAESAKTTRVIAAVPEGNRDYRPDPKSRSAWELASHLATADVWFLDSIINGAFDRSRIRELPAGSANPQGASEWYERSIAECLTELRAMTPDDLLRPVQFFRGTRPAVYWLTLMNNHSIHHRGQLAAYLRAAGSKVPALFGRSADEDLVSQQSARV